MKKITLRIVVAIIHIGRFFGARWLLQQLNRGLRALSSFTHFLQLVVEWGASPNPEWFDHFIDVHYSWKKTGNPLPWERGIFNLLAIKNGASILELCCGDGFNAHHFYAIRASQIYSMDFDPKAIASAKRNFKRENVNYAVGDIRKDMPAGPFDNILWDAAIEHFTESEIAQIMVMITERLGTNGILSGYTIVEQADGPGHHEHEYEFHSKEDLMRFLSPYFKHVRIFETIYPTRHNLYFFAANGAGLPFDENWPAHLIK